ncbi:hypothetical protein LSH36_349g01012 [Paralvinella palmiformis]|uniref:Tetraspanin n=1 Tax=Paralvinella palmiformis TaxID=53620 RepID=A0AAD9JF42_9ANNE|nr:hypothetical protein LSH36_349g01012 [Paralvinella palmiformis]
MSPRCRGLSLEVYGDLVSIIGICLFGIGIWLGKVKGQYDSINDTLTAPVILAVILGLFMMIFAFMGLIGAIKEQIFLLKIWRMSSENKVYVGKWTKRLRWRTFPDSNRKHRINTSITKSSKDGFVQGAFRSKKSFTATFDTMSFFTIAIIVFLGQVIIGILAFIYREEFKCCGLNGANNWQRNELYSCDSEDPIKACGVPDSCCKVFTEGCGQGLRNQSSSEKLEDVVFEKGCTTKFRVWMEKHLDIVGATALGLSLLHVLGIFFTYFFITAVQDRVWLFKYRKRYYDN